jgi:hypothetical protein
MIRIAAIVAMLFLAACAAQPRVDIDLRMLDGVPAVPIETRTGICTGLLMDDGQLLTCSHGIPRGEAGGEMVVAGLATRYTVIRSGDNLERTWSSWHGKVPAALDQDWSLISTQPGVDPRQVFSVLVPAPLSAVAAPKPGDTVYIVGYTARSQSPSGSYAGYLVRHWVPMLVVEPPGHYAADHQPIIWLTTGSSGAAYMSTPTSTAETAGHPDSLASHGYSGAPVLRKRSDGKLETCAIMVAGDNKTGDGRGTFAVAIPLPPGVLVQSSTVGP